MSDKMFIHLANTHTLLLLFTIVNIHSGYWDYSNGETCPVLPKFIW